MILGADVEPKLHSHTARSEMRYLVPDITVDKVRYCLVHPYRLGPLPVFAPEGAL